MKKGISINVDRKKTKRRVRRLEDDVKDIQLKANVLGGLNNN